MLVHQAAVQLRSWTGEQPPVAAMWQAATSALGAR
jgi:shikimate 5-dehydrogenase